MSHTLLQVIKIGSYLAGRTNESRAGDGKDPLSLALLLGVNGPEIKHDFEMRRYQICRPTLKLDFND